MWFLTTASFEKVLENGMQKKVNEKYLVDAMSCTEAEARTIEVVKPFVTGDLKITSTKEENYTELFVGEGDYFYDAKVGFVTLDEKSGREKIQKTKMLIQADDVKSAISNLEKGMKGTLSDWKLHGIQETQIMDIVLYNKDSE